jgi:hypothetical protein
MAIHIECSSCGHQNELGRVFCASCGLKLDLNATSMSELQDKREIDYGKWIRFTVVGLSVLVLGGITGALLWPVNTPVVLHEDAGAVQIPIKARAARTTLSYNREIKFELTEGELNGFMTERARSRKIGKLAIDLKTGTFVLYAGFNWTPATNVTWLAKVKIPISMEMRGTFQGGVMGVEWARIGHCPLPGSVKNIVVEYFASTFSDVISEKGVVSALKEVAISDTQASLVLRP